MTEALKHVLVVGGIREAHDALLAQHCKLTWFVKGGTLMPGDQHRPCHQIFIFHKETADAVLADMALTLHRAEAFDCVCAFHDEVQMTASVIARALRVPFPYTGETITRTRNKFEMRCALSAAGLNTVPYARAECTEDIERFLWQNPAIQTCIVKPLDGTGSYGVRQISQSDAASLDALMHGQTHRFPMLIEEYIAGREYSVETFTHEGRHYVTAVTEKFKKPGTFMESGHLVPARLSAHEQEHIGSSVRQYLTALGVRFGPTHTEIMVNHRGVSMIETHTRVGGDQIPTLVKLATGIDLYDLAARQALRRELDCSVARAGQPHTHACIKFLVQDGNNEEITAIEGVSELTQWPGVKHVQVRYKVGDTLVPVQHSFDRAASVLTVGATAEEALAAADQALSNIRITTSRRA